MIDISSILLVSESIIMIGLLVFGFVLMKIEKAMFHSDVSDIVKYVFQILSTFIFIIFILIAFCHQLLIGYMSDLPVFVGDSIILAFSICLCGVLYCHIRDGLKLYKSLKPVVSIPDVEVKAE